MKSTTWKDARIMMQGVEVSILKSQVLSGVVRFMCFAHRQLFALMEHFPNFRIPDNLYCIGCDK